MTTMHGVVQVHASQYREDISLQEGNEKFESGHGDRHDERQDCAADAERAERAHGGDEACENLKRDVAGQHVREKTDGKADRTRQEGDHFNRRHKRQKRLGHARGGKDAEEMQAVLVETVNDDRTDDEAGEREGNDDLAGDREEIREHAEQVCRQHEHEQRENEGEEHHALFAGAFTQHGGDELIGHFGNGLHAGRDKTAVRRCEIKETRSSSHGRDHEERRIGEGKIDAANFDRNDRLHQELMGRIVCHRLPSLPVAACRGISTVRKNSLKGRVFHPRPVCPPSPAAAAWPPRRSSATHSIRLRRNREEEERSSPTATCRQNSPEDNPA
ncbi:hypothetical protein AT6N2_C1762 [Agrobacterium tumefaciens]|nr:hypothetical protein AT6N2_C1762 [Agrobacterium tumefaciens]